MLPRIAQRDLELSKRVHRLRCGFGDYLLLLPALVFSSYGIPLLLIALFVVTSIEVALLYLAGCLTTLVVTTSAKAHVKRNRPTLESIGPRKVTIRQMETNHAWPSGDSAQAAVFSTLTALLTGFALVPVVITPLVMFSRIYFGFHWIGDTLGGAAIGATIAGLVFMLSQQFL